MRSCRAASLQRREALALVTAGWSGYRRQRILAPAGLAGAAFQLTGCGLEIPRVVPPAMVIIGAQCWRHTMIVPPECTLSVDVEGWKGHSAGCGSAAAVEPLAWGVHDFNCWLITDGRAG